jgi:hypothetical protein
VTPERWRLTKAVFQEALDLEGAQAAPRRGKRGAGQIVDAPPPTSMTDASVGTPDHDGDSRLSGHRDARGSRCEGDARCHDAESFGWYWLELIARAPVSRSRPR